MLHCTIRFVSGLVLLTLLASPVNAQTDENRGLDFSFQPGFLQDDDEAAEAAPVLPFGAKGTRRFTILGGGGTAVNDNRSDSLGYAGAGWTWFLEDDISVNIELIGMYFAQSHDGDEVGAGFNLLFRWHFLKRDNWTMYIDGGAGFMVATGDVPTGGTDYNFMPQAGLGFSWDLGDEKRLMTGARWHHMSNASFSDNNPGIDSVIAYIGISMPW